MENFIVQNARLHEERQFRLQLVDAYQETDKNRQAEAFTKIVENSKETDAYKLDDTKLLIQTFKFAPLEYGIENYMTDLVYVPKPTEHFLKIGELEYYNENLHGQVQDPQADQTTRKWKALGRTLPNCVTSENATVLYTDASRTTVDWINTMLNLREVTSKLHYTKHHLHRAINRLASWFCGPQVEIVLREMDINEKAQFLMSKTPRPNPYVQLMKQLQSLVRLSGTSLYQILNESHGIALALFHKEKPDQKKLKINKLMLHCLLRFTVGTVKTTIKSMVDRCTLHQTELPKWNEIAHSAELTELMGSLPEYDLPYKKKSDTGAMELFNMTLGEEKPGTFKNATKGLYYEDGYLSREPIGRRPTDFFGPTLNNPIGNVNLQGPPAQQQHPVQQGAQGHGPPPQGEDGLEEARAAHAQMMNRDAAQDVAPRGAMGQQFKVAPSNGSTEQREKGAIKKSDKAKKDHGTSSMSTRSGSNANKNQDSEDVSVDYYGSNNRNKNRSSRYRDKRSFSRDNSYSRSYSRNNSRQSRPGREGRNSRRDRDRRASSYSRNRNRNKGSRNDRRYDSKSSRDSSYGRSQSRSQSRDRRTRDNKDSQYYNVAGQAYRRDSYGQNTNRRYDDSRRPSRSDNRSSYNRNNNSRRQSNVSTNSARGRHQYKNKDKYGERKYYNTKDGMKRRDSYSKDRQRRNSSTTDRRSRDYKSGYASDNRYDKKKSSYSRKSMSPKSDTELHHMTDHITTDNWIENDDIMHMNDNSDDRDIIADMVPLLNLE